ncbi:TIGR04219 family outer membrane beta-barrel protein [Geobacter sp.]|uniref:TIGR04219 family outer membrane beta-barrel protein n=1 Tax=Geobacter sp. TaxID=46610 RepID=UPI00261FF95C|nr:TIGR04219 family outer membrane beta-barrel protein [Geobacter sp.]
MGFKQLVGGALLLLMGTAASAGATGIEAAVGVWNHTPRGTIAYQGTSLDLKDELKYGDETRLTGRVKVETPLFFPNLYLMATPMEFKEQGIKSSTFTFGNQTFTANTAFTSKLRLDHYDLGLYWGLPFLRTATANILNVDLGIDARLVDLKAEVAQGATTESKSLTVPVPMLYAGVQVKPLSWLAGEAEARGIAYGKDRYFDIIGRGKLILFDHVFAAAGYRYEKLKIDESDVKADVNFGGPFGEVGFQF